jgi:type VI secretion system protein ImpC
MAKSISFGKLGFKLVSSMDEPQGVPEPETPFRVLILGDFSGRANRGLFEPGAALAGRHPLLVDRDNFDEVLAKLGVEVHVRIGDDDRTPVAIGFSELDDFHPDQIYEAVEVFRSLRQTRQKLNDPGTFAATAAEMGAFKEDQPAIKARTPAPELAGLTSGSLLDHILDETEDHVAEGRPSPASSEWDVFLHEIVKPHLVPKEDPQQAEVLAAVDASTSELMRTVLHQPDFQAIEAAWRAVHFLVSRLETDTQLRLYLLDISKAELTADLNGTEDLRATGTYRLLVEQTVETPGGEPWAVLAGNYTFDRTREDAQLLGRMAKIAGTAGAPFISSAHAHLLGCESLAETPDPNDWQQLANEEGSEAWEALRRLPEAIYVGLALPRFMLRLPYGEETDPTEQFEFEEMAAQIDHEHYLWGNPIFACVYLVSEAFSRYGWDLRLGVIQDIGGLPLHIYREQGESRIKPCAEVVLTERGAERILEKGFMPLLSFRNQDRIRLARFQSLADPLTHLMGRWG